MKKLILKLKTPDLAALEQSLEDADAILKNYFWLHDRIFIPRNFAPDQSWPRLILRTEMRSTDRPPRYTLILKRHISDSGIDITHTTEVFDYEATAAIILQLGFEFTHEFARRRQIVEWQDQIFWIDKIEGLDDYYLKLETVITADDTVANARDQLTALAAQLSPTLITVDSPYFSLLPPIQS